MRRRYCSDTCAAVAKRKANLPKETAVERSARSERENRQRLAQIRGALIRDPFATIREIASTTGYGETQVTTAIRQGAGMTLNEYRREVYRLSHQSAA